MDIIEKITTSKVNKTIDKDFIKFYFWHEWNVRNKLIRVVRFTLKPLRKQLKSLSQKIKNYLYFKI